MNVLIDDLIKHLSEFKDYAVSLDSIESAHTIAKNELDKTTEALAQVKDDLAKAQAGLSVSQLANLKEHEEAVFAKRKEYEDISVKVERARAELDTLTAEIVSAHATHAGIEASIESLRKKHFA